MTRTFFDKMLCIQSGLGFSWLLFLPMVARNTFDLRDNMAFAAKRYGKEIIVVETGYYWRQSNLF
jgi:arabinogalactan endo-1,4-beta-galactosidase